MSVLCKTLLSRNFPEDCGYHLAFHSENVYCTGYMAGHMQASSCVVFYVFADAHSIPKGPQGYGWDYSLPRTPESPTCSTLGASLLQIIKVMYVKCWLYLLCWAWFGVRIVEEKFFCPSLCLCDFITRYCQYFVGCFYCTFSACKTEDSEAFGIGAWYPA